MLKFEAVLTSTVMPLDGTYTVQTVQDPMDLWNALEGVPHYIGHPDTKMLLESVGCVKAPSNLFTGLEVGQSALCCSLAKPRSSGLSEFTTHQSVSEFNNLTLRILTRVA